MSKRKTIVVVGGVAGGMSFATRYRRLNEADRIIVLDKGPYVSFANCGLPYHVSGEIENREDLIVVSKSRLEARFNLEIYEEHDVIKINSENKEVIARHHDKETTFSYDELVLSPGAKPFVPDIKGLESADHVFTLRNIPDVDKINAFLESKKPRNAIVVGAGFIGLEMAENLSNKGLAVTVVEKSPQVLGPLDEEMSAFAYNELKRNKVDLHLNTSIIEVKANKAVLEDGSELDADMIIMSIGVAPESQLAKDAGLKLGMRDGIIVDEKYQTSKDHIYAVGDAIIVKHTITKEDALISLASPANRQGRQLADILSGKSKTNKGSLGTSIIRLFDLEIASTGLNERQIQGRNYEVMHLEANNHAGYFPNATLINMKVIFDKDTQEIYGAQAVGKAGVDKRIDVIATAIKSKMKIVDLQELELTYAPPFGTAKDIVNLVGYVAENLINKTTESIQIKDLKNYHDAILIDVRSEEEVSRGVIDNAIHVPLERLREYSSKLDKSKPVILYCQSGGRSYNGERILKQLGFEAYNLDSSYGIYKQMKEAGQI